MTMGDFEDPLKGNALLPDIPKAIARPENQPGKLRPIIQSIQFSGPLPHPQLMAEYEKCLPGAADRILQMAEKQQGHRFGLENSVIGGDIRRADMGLWLAFSLFVLFGLGAIFLLAIGKDIAGYSLLGTSLLGGAGLFIRVGRERQQAQQIQKQQPSTNRKKNKHSRK